MEMLHSPALGFLQRWNLYIVSERRPTTIGRLSHTYFGTNTRGNSSGSFISLAM
jgi:hypothetical protein